MGRPGTEGGFRDRTSWATRQRGQLLSASGNDNPEATASRATTPCLRDAGRPSADLARRSTYQRAETQQHPACDPGVCNQIEIIELPTERGVIVGSQHAEPAIAADVHVVAGRAGNAEPALLLSDDRALVVAV
jgi:hypothetical protein